MARSRQKRSPSVKVAIVHTYMDCAREYRRSRTLSYYSTSPLLLPLVPFKPLPARPLSSFPIALAPAAAAAVPLSQQWHWGEITIPAAYFTMTLATTRRGSPQRLIRFTRRQETGLLHASGPTRYSPRLLSTKFYRGAFDDQRFREGVPPLLRSIRATARQ